MKKQTTNKRKLKTPLDMLAGYTHAMLDGDNIIVINYTDSRTVDIRFVGYVELMTVQAGNIRRGTIKNLMKPNVFGKGFFGVGSYSMGAAYTIWTNMLRRCYCHKSLAKRPSYTDCYVVDDWLNFQNFARWFHKESSYVEGFHLDKDLCVQNNKAYGPKYCKFIPVEVNNAVLSRNASRGKYKLGVYWKKENNKFAAQYSKEGASNQEYLGLFDSENEAHEAYKKCKYAYLKKLAERQEDTQVKKALVGWVIPEY